MYSSERNQHNGADPMGWIDDLREALCAPELEEFDHPEAVPSRDAKEAAYATAVALGRCRIFGLAVPKEMDGAMPEPEAIAAAEIATEFVRQWTEDARQLPSEWDQADPWVGQSMCAELLEARMEAHFVMEAVSQALEKSWDEGKDGQDLLVELDQLAQALEEFDQALQEPETLALLSTVVELPLLENWRSMLAGVHKECPPWWLDGTLEAVDRYIEKVCQKTLPAGEQWRRLAAPRLEWVRLAEEPALPEAAEEVAAPERGARPRIRRHPAVKIFQIQPICAAAAETPTYSPPIETFLQWSSPDGRFLARLSIPSEAAETEMLVMEFLTPEEQLATELAGQPVWLGGVAADIDPAGLTRFPVQQLKEQLGQPEAQLILEVGDDHMEWFAVENT